MTRGVLLREWLNRAGGIAHTSTARVAGFTDQDMRTAIARDDIRRLRRSWLITPAAPPPGIRAVIAGGKLTCLSEAARLGLWVPDDDTLHVSRTPTSSERLDPEIRYHWSRGPSPVARRAWREPLINVLAHVAACVPREEGLAVWSSALRLTELTHEHLARVKWAGPAARFAAANASLLSDSGLETYVVERLRPFGVRLRQQIWIEGHPVDVLVGDRLVIQIDGFEHHRTAKDRRRDIAHDARLVLLGYTVLRFDYSQVVFGWAEVESTILTAMSQGLHR
jgi:very-short-patch-repair endonuclease